METKDKVMYESPASEVLEMKVERSICESETRTEAEITSYRPDYGNGGEQYWN